MIVIVSNRNVNEGATDHTVFGDEPNRKGLDELRVATAEYREADGWHVSLLSERRRDLERGKPPSRVLFDRIMQQIEKGEVAEDWVLFVHGFNQSFLKNLTKCKALEDIYSTNVLAFSWPSNQGGFKTDEYKKARAAARGCTNAFDRMLEKLATYLISRPFMKECRVRFSLLAYSMGNFVVENFVRAPVFTDETGIFDNIVLTQADVDVDTHAEWVNRLRLGRQVYVTINEEDSVLKWSDVVNPPRLGNTVRNLQAQNTIYFDFTSGKDVGTTHGIFYKTVKVNPVVKEVLDRALRGGRAEHARGLMFNDQNNTWELAEKKDRWEHMDRK